MYVMLLVSEFLKYALYFKGENPVSSKIQLVPHLGPDASSPATADAPVQLGPVSAGARLAHLLV